MRIGFFLCMLSGGGGGGAPGPDVTAPTLSSAVIPTNGLTLALTYGETLDSGSVPSAGAFSLTGTVSTVASVGIAGAVVTLTLSAAAFQGETITVSYTPGGSPIQDAAGNDAAALTAQAVANGSSVAAPESRAAAAVGPFPSSSVSLSSAVALDRTVGTTMVWAIEVTARTGFQTFFSSMGATSGGFQLQFSTTQDGIFFTGGTSITTGGGQVPIGIVVSANSRIAGGSMRGSRNGSVAAQRSAAPTYNTITGAPSTTIGKAAVGTASQMTAGKLLWFAVLKRDATDAELQAWSDTANTLDRYRPPADLVTAINTTGAGSWLFDSYTDYDSAAATSPTGIGSGPTWTRNSNLGSGFPVKTAIEEEIEHVIQLGDWHFNVQDITTTAQSSGPVYHRGNCFREYRFTSNAARFAVKGICDWSGVTNLNTLGVRQDNTPLADLTFDRFSVFRRLDALGLSGSHTYRIIDGAQAINGGAGSAVYNNTGVKAVTSVLVQAPKTATFSVIAPTPAAGRNRLMVLGDSFTVGEDATVSATTESEVMLLRDAYPGDVIAFCFGSGAHFHFFKDATTYNALIADAATWFSGAATARVLDLLGTNDQGFATLYANRAAFITLVGAGFDAWHTAQPTVTFHMRTPTLRTGAYEGSTVIDATPTVGTGGGTVVNSTILQNTRDDLTTVRSTRTSYILSLIDGKACFPFFAPSSNHGTDNFHPSGWVGGVPSGGHNTIYLQFKGAMAAAADSVGSGF